MENLNLGHVKEVENKGYEKCVLLKRLGEIMDETESFKEVLKEICNLKIENNTKVKIIIQKQDYTNSINTTYEKIIAK